MFAKLIKTRKRYQLKTREGVIKSGTAEQCEAFAKARGLIVLYPAWGPTGETTWVSVPA